MCKALEGSQVTWTRKVCAWLDNIVLRERAVGYSQPAEHTWYRQILIHYLLIVPARLQDTDAARLIVTCTMHSRLAILSTHSHAVNRRSCRLAHLQ